ncbi:MAG TPA: nuclear transport factor 2 family protein [Gemmatimonadaceae bacterium]|jgi:uncharacterized protein (TIGR02246 family)|nr:nuclear transport factor 2 family protein [Gemmatimonadaceae bacterium]
MTTHEYTKQDRHPGQHRSAIIVVVTLTLATAACTSASQRFTTASSTVPASGATPIQNLSSPDSSVRLEIIAMLDSSAHAWNRGDLDGFVASYDPTMHTTFVGPASIIRGPDAIKAVYAPRFAPGGVRDSLSFENVEIDLLAPDAANVIAYYRLMRGDSTTSHGPTSLVMRKRGNGWRIVHDHSS